MKKYYIFHAINPQYSFTETINQQREYAGYVIADSLERAFVLSQGDFNDDWNKRSTSVGDIIKCEGNFYMVTGIGFMELSPNPNPSKSDMRVKVYGDERLLMQGHNILFNL